MRADEFLLLGPEIVLGTAGLLLLVFGSVGRGTGVRERSAPPRDVPALSLRSANASWLASV